MKGSLLLASCIFLSGFSFAQQKDTLKTLKASRVSSAPKIDGLLDDEMWNGADIATDFIQKLPVEGGSVSQKTEVRIIYDNYAVYVGAMMYDSAPDSILKELGSRDDEGLNAERFRFVIDPYRTLLDAYVFQVYASGVQADNRYVDYTYNAVWQSAVHIYDQRLPAGRQGWSVEMKIPYSAIRFPNKKEQLWGLEFAREIQRSHEFHQWVLTPADQPNPAKYFGLLTGITDIKPPLRLSLTPYLSSYFERAPEYNADGTYHNANSFSYNAGADIKYGLNESFTLDMTLLPDFGQVQSDNKVKNISYQETFYEDYRSFFKEGTELFNKLMFYSRRIGKTPSLYYAVPSLLDSGEIIAKNPSQAKLLNATKLSGRTKDGTGIGLFNAITDNTYATVKDPAGKERKILTEPLTNYNAIVFDQQLKNSSKINFMNTNVIRDGSGYRDANVSSTAFTFQNKKNSWAVDGEAALSQLFTRNDSIKDSFENQMGYKYVYIVRKISGTWQYGVGHEALSSTFNRNDMGYMGSNNFATTRTYLTYNRYKPWRSLLNGNIGVSVDYSQNFTNHQRTNFSTNLNMYGQFKNYWGLWCGTQYYPLSSHEFFEPRVPGRFSYNLEGWWAWMGFTTDSRKKLAFTFNINPGGYNKKNLYNLPAPVTVGYNLSPRFRVNDKLSFTYLFNYQKDPNNLGFANIDTANNIIYGERILHTYENMLNAKYIFKNDLSFSLNARHYWNTGEYIRYYTLLTDGMLEKNYTYSANNNFSYNAFTIDAVFSWQFAPGSQLSIVYKNVIEKDEQIILPKFNDNFSQTLTSPQTNSISLKVLYYLDYQYLKKNKIKG